MDIFLERNQKQETPYEWLFDIRPMFQNNGL